MRSDIQTWKKKLHKKVRIKKKNYTWEEKKNLAEQRTFSDDYKGCVKSNNFYGVDPNYCLLIVHLCVCVLKMRLDGEGHTDVHIWMKCLWLVADTGVI